MRDIQKQHAGCICHIRSAFASKAKAGVVFWQKKVPYALPVVGFVFANPENFRQREVWQGGIARELNQALQAKCAREVAALLLGAYVAPDECRADNISFFVEKDRAMHLAREADAGDVLAREVIARERFANCCASSAPPVFRMLLRPANLRRCKGLVVFGRGRYQATSLINYDGPRAASADINSEDVNKASSTASGQLSGDIIYSQARMTKRDNCQRVPARNCNKTWSRIVEISPLGWS
jgi:hypothetical protein